MARLSGARGSIYLKDSTSKLADSYSWEFMGAQDIMDATVIGEAFKRYMPDVSNARVRIQSFVPDQGSSQAITPLTSVLVGNAVTTAGVGTPIDFVLELVDGGVSTPTPNAHELLMGQGYVVSSTLRVARDGIVTDEIEIEVDGPLGFFN